jgi:hypothetical protein
VDRRIGFLLHLAEQMNQSRGACKRDTRLVDRLAASWRKRFLRTKTESNKFTVARVAVVVGAARSHHLSILQTSNAHFSVRLFRERIHCSFAKSNPPLGSIQHDSMIGIADFGAAQSLKCQLFVGDDPAD